MDRIRLENSKEYLYYTHSPESCKGDWCTIHDRSPHHMRGFPQQWRSDRRIMERRNPFGGACPDPDSPWESGSWEWVHGCITNPYYPLVGMCGKWYINNIEAAWLTKTYAVTSDGKLWTFLTDYSKAIERKGKVYRNRNVIDLWGTNDKIDQMVAGAWLGERPVGKKLVHKDGNNLNDRLSNLEYR